MFVGALELDALHTGMAGFGRGLRGTVRVLSNTAAMSEILPPLIGRFLIEHPDIDVDLQELSSDGVLDAIRRDVADVGIVADYVDTSGMQTQPLAEDRLVALVPNRRPRKRPPAMRRSCLWPIRGRTAGCWSARRRVRPHRPARGPCLGS